MTKKDFLNALANGLKDLPPDKLSDILFDYQDYFNSQKNTMTEEEIILSFGSIDNIIDNYRKENSVDTSTNTISEFTQEIPVIDDTIVEEIIYDAISEDTEDFIKKDTINYNNNSYATNKTRSNSKKEKTDTSSTFKLKEKISKKSFMGYLFSLPILAITLPIGLGLGIASFASYLSFLLLIISIGALIFLISLVPFSIGIAGFIVILFKSLGSLIFINIPNFILEFPSIFIVLISLSLLLLSIGIFFLGISYCRSAKRTLIKLSKTIFNLITRRKA